MSGIIAGAGAAIPSSFQFLDWKVSSFSIASGSTASPYAISGTQKTILLNPTLNAAIPAGGSSVFQIGPLLATAKVTSANTDTYVVGVYASVDNGATFNLLNNGGLITIASGNNGKTVGNATAEPSAPDLNINAPATANKVILQLMVSDATSPTTDAFSITNLRISGLAVINA